MITFGVTVLVYKILDGLAPPPLDEFMKENQSSSVSARALSKGSCKTAPN